MTPLAYRSKTASISYIVTLILCLLMAGMGKKFALGYVICGWAGVVICMAMLILISRQPPEPILLKNPKELQLHDGTVIPLSRLDSVTCRRSGIRGFTHQWGFVTLQVGEQKYSYSYVEDCEDVVKDILAWKKRAGGR